MLRKTTAALLGWLLALAGAVLVAGLLSGADAASAFGVGRTSLRFAPPDTLPQLTQLAPIDAVSAPWAVRVARPRGAASGTIVRWSGKSWLVTAAHVVSWIPALAWLLPPLSPSPLFALSATDERRYLSGGRVSYWWDIAVFPFDRSGNTGVELRNGAPAMGEAMRFTGYPSGQGQPAAGTGAVVAVTPHQRGGAAAVVVGTTAQVGQSGGALTDAEGRLVGIGVATTPYGVLAVGNGAIAEVLAELDQLPLVEPGVAERLLAWLVITGVAIALAIGIDKLAQRAAKGKVIVGP